jgi:hypothetical protein
MAGNVPWSLARESKLLAEQDRTSREDDCPSIAPKGRTQSEPRLTCPAPSLLPPGRALFAAKGLRPAFVTPAISRAGGD